MYFNNIIKRYINDKESGWEQLIRIIDYLQSVNIQQDDVLYQAILSHTNEFGIPGNICKSIWNHIIEFFDISDMMNTTECRNNDDQMVQIRILKCKYFDMDFNFR